MKDNVIIFHQILHGYSDGHQQLESSIDLPKETKRIILVLSDMSGPNMIEGFENYLTGYPLPETEYYAFAKTWYASEMKRPGCVWTHTILIQNKYFNIIQDLSVIPSLFNRPKSNRSDYSSYSIPVNINEVELTLKGDISDTFSIDVGMEFIFHLYDKASHPILIPVDNSMMYENLILNMWSQQWPKLRSSFSFCTGSLSNRSLNGEYFDFQLVPIKGFRKFKNTISTFYMVDIDNNYRKTKTFPEWVSIGIKDLLQDKEREFRNFIRDVCDEECDSRSIYSRLAIIYSLLKSVDKKQKPIEKLFEVLYKYYPTPKEGDKIKSIICGSAKEKSFIYFNSLSELDIFLALVKTKYHSMFSPKSLNIEARTKSLWQKNSKSVQNILRIMVNNETNPFSVKIFEGIAKAIQPKELLDISKEIPSILFVFAKVNPILFASKSLWFGSNDYQRELLDHLFKSSAFTGKTKKAIVFATLEAKADAVAEALNDYFDNDILYALLEWIDQNVNKNDFELTSDWLMILKKSPKNCLSWFAKTSKPKAKLALFIISELDPNSPEVQKFGTGVWIKLLTSLENEIESQNKIIFAEFLLPFGLNNPGPNSDQLVAVSFEIIHEALANKKLSYNSWRYLDPILPDIGLLKSWDKCERLRRGLVKSFYTKKWSIEQFLKCVSERELFKQVIKSAHKTKEGKNFLARVLKTIIDEKIKVDNARLKILIKYT